MNESTIPPPAPLARLWLAYFFAATLVIGAATFAVGTPFMLAGRWWRAPRRVGAQVFQRGVRVLLACQPWLRAEVRIPLRAGDGRGTLYVSNHRSTLDTFFLLAQVSGIRVLAKRRLRLIPGVGEAMWLTRQVLVAKDQPDDFLRAMRTVARGLADGEAFHIFPEYTRCPPAWRGTQKFSAAPFQVAQAAGARIVPVVFRDTDTAWPKGFFGLRFRIPVRVEALPPVEATAFPTARLLMQAVKARIDAALEAPG